MHILVVERANCAAVPYASNASVQPSHMFFTNCAAIPYVAARLLDPQF